MKCPHCDYEETEFTDDRDEGVFWKISNGIILVREAGYFDQQSAFIHGCPKCKKLFVSDF